MTQSDPGSSLLQAPGDQTHQHAHAHAHARSHHAYLHSKRQDQAGEADSSIVEVVQTVAVVQVIDGSGKTLSVATRTSEPTTTQIPADSLTGQFSALDEPSSTAGSEDASSMQSSPSSNVATSQGVAVSSSFASSTHLSAASTYASLTSASNSTATAHSNSTATVSHSPALTTLTANNTVFTIFDVSSSSAPLSSSSTLTTDGILSTISITPSASTSGTGGGGYGGVAATGGGSAATGAAASATTTAAAASGSGSSGRAATLAGSVLGAVAGVGVILFLALLMLRWKKRHDALKLRRSLGDQGTHGLIGEADNSGGPSGPLSPTSPTKSMTEDRSAPFVNAGALATLTAAYHRFSGRSSTYRSSAYSQDSEGEKGFTKVAGRKLPSVIEHGGDGFSDPRETMASGTSSVLSGQSFYRDSRGFYGGAGSHPTFAVGSPMRPDSGVINFNPGPAKTPVTEQGRFAPGSPSLSPPPRDPLGRSHPSSDGSHASGSRFSEQF